MNAASVSSVTDKAMRVGHDLEQLKDVTGRVVGSVFYGTMLKMMRESKLKGPYGHGGRGEDVFAAQLHGILAERMGSQTKGGIADAIYQHLQKQQSLISKQPAPLGEVQR